MTDDKVRAQYALQIIQNPVFQQACEVLEKEIVEAWAECPARDQEGKDYFWRLLKSHRRFISVFRGYVESGKIVLEREKQEQSALQKMQDNVTKFAERFRR